MPASADNTASYSSPNYLTFLYQRHRSRLQGIDHFHLRPIPTASHDAGRRESYGDKLNRIYPRELTNPPATLRPSAVSHPITSPLLSALGTTTNTAAQYTSDWARSLPFVANPPGSHSNSPPPHLGSNGRDGSLGPMLNSSSPPGLRPQSHPNQYPSFGGRPSQTRDRRSSMYAQFGHRVPYGGHAPLPHEDQAHFHAGGLPDLDSFGPPNASTPGLSPGEKGYYCGFDTLATAAHGPSVPAENVLTVGYEGGLRIYRVSRKNIDIIGRLEGLQGAVVGAKILPWTFRADPGSSGRPYIALIVHGPVLADGEANSSNSSVVPSLYDQENSPEPSTESATGPPPDIRDVVKEYQTTVEVYSLSTREHIATVFRSPTVEVEYPPIGDYKIPPPIGDLKIDANGKFLVVASGVSGEIFIFSPWTKDQELDDLQSIRCVGKLWTSVQRRDIKANSSASSTVDAVSIPEDLEPSRGTPLFSLSQRWLATVPPASTSLFSMKGVALLPNHDARPPGITLHMAPPLPTTNCAVDTPENESFMNRMSREVTQGVLKGAKWMGEQGLHAWNTYWNKGPGGVPPGGSPYVSEATHQPSFPPTHGYQSPSPGQSDPNQVAIFDLQRLLDAEEMKVKNALGPIATFEPPSGCSYLSFAPSGLVLLTVSRKGDQQFVWSLMKMQHPRSGTTLNQYPGPYVRQMAKFTRMTVAKVVDVAWIAPQGNRFSLLTERGTMHVHEIPAPAFLWPPLRRAHHQKEAQKIQDSKENDQPPSPKGAINSAMETINGTGAWLRSVSVRSRSLGNNSGFSNLMMTPAVGANVSSKAVKAGLSKGVSLVANSANTIYHASENKLHMNYMINGASPGCMRWMTGKDRGHLAIVVTGTLSIYPVKQTSLARKGKPPVIRAKISKRPIEFVLHKIPDDQFAPAFRASIEARFGPTRKDTAATGLAGVWTLRNPATPKAVHHHPLRGTENWHALVEAETNPPYQPFHTDRRITLFAYPEPETPAPKSPAKDASAEETEDYERARDDWQCTVLGPWLQDVHHVDTNLSYENIEPWVFGEEITAAKVLSGGTGGGLDGFSDDEDAVENKIRVVEGGDGEQVVVTSVRRKGREEEEFFEDGCEVLDFADDRV